MRDIFAEAADQDFLAKDPARKAKVPTQLRETDKTTLTWDQLRKALSELDDRDRLLLELDMTNALRPSELFGLRWKCFNEAASSMSVTETVYKGKIRPWGKTQRSLATVHLPKDLAKQLAAWRQQAPDPSPEAFIFPNQTGGFLDTDNYRKRVLHKLAKDLGLPKLTFLIPAVALGYVGSRVAKREAAPAAEAEPAKKAAEKPENMASALRLDELSLEIGFQLIPLVDEKQGGQMLQRVKTLRRHLAGELGFLIPPVHISDNLRLKAREYVFSLRGVEIGRWQTEGNCLLAVSTEAQPRPLPGRETREPAYGAPARWIQPALENDALAAGYSVVDQGTVIGTHLAELIRRHAHELLGRAETKRLLDSLGESHPKLVEELVPKLLSLGEVQRVLQQLLREQVSIRDLGTILESLVETAAQSRALPQLVEAARQSLGRRLTRPLLDTEGTLKVIAMEPAVEEELMALVVPEAGARLLTAGTNTPVLRRIADSLKRLIGPGGASAQPVLLCPSPARYYLKRWLEPLMPRLTVVAPSEIPPEVPVRAAGVVRQGA